MSGCGFGIVRPGGTAKSHSTGASMKTVIALFPMVVLVPAIAQLFLAAHGVVGFESGRS
jgi:hypothetical protein